MPTFFKSSVTSNMKQLPRFMIILSLSLSLPRERRERTLKFKTRGFYSDVLLAGWTGNTTARLVCARERWIELELIKSTFSVSFRLKLWFKRRISSAVADTGREEDASGEQINMQKLFLLITAAEKLMISSLRRPCPYLVQSPLIEEGTRKIRHILSPLYNNLIFVLLKQTDVW